MENLTIPAMERSPFVDFNFETGLLRIRGESYPDDASRVFGPIFEALDTYLADGFPGLVRFEIELVYFNSSSAKALMNMFKRLEQAAARGQKIQVDLNHLAFNLVEIDGA